MEIVYNHATVHATTTAKNIHREQLSRMRAVSVALARMEMSSVKTNHTATVTVDTLSGPNGAVALSHVEEVYRQEAEVATILPRQAMAKTVRDHLLKQDLAIKAAAQRALW